jgi:hypothetical protein
LNLRMMHKLAENSYSLQQLEKWSNAVTIK